MTAFNWLLENEYPLLLLLFVEGMIPYGYGDVMQVPAVGIFMILTVHECNVMCDRSTCFNTSHQTFYFSLPASGRAT